MALISKEQKMVKSSTEKLIIKSKVHKVVTAMQIAATINVKVDSF